MKLINADALKKDMVTLPNYSNGLSDTYDKSLIIGLIDEQIVVDATPAVWHFEFDGCGRTERKALEE